MTANAGAIPPDQKTVVITGVSTGIGLGAARVFAAKGFHVFGSVRKQADADRLKQELGDSFTPLIFDVTDEAGAQTAANTVRDALGGRTLTALINNAGIAVAGPLLKLPVKEFRQQLEVNLTGVVITSQAFAPLLGVDDSLTGPPGRIANISSVGGRTAFPFMGPYHVSKFGLEGMSESLRRELMPFGVDVIVIAPGSVATPIWDKGERTDTTAYAGTPYAKPLERLKSYMVELGRKGLPAEFIGAKIYHAMTTPKPRWRYTIAPDPIQMFLTRNLPKRMVDKTVAKQLGLLPPKS